MENAAQGRQTELPNRETLKSDAADILEKAKQAGQQKLDTGRGTAADQAQKVAGVFEQVSAQFQESDLQTLADYSTRIANTIIKFSDDLRNRNIDDILRNTHDIARRNPAMFLLGSVAVGFAISRFFKASSERPTRDHLPERAESPYYAAGAEYQPESPAAPIEGAPQTIKEF